MNVPHLKYHTITMEFFRRLLKSKRRKVLQREGDPVTYDGRLPPPTVVFWEFCLLIYAGV